MMDVLWWVLTCDTKIFTFYNDSHRSIHMPLFHISLLPIFFKKDFIYLLLERGEMKEKERERNINVWLPLTCPFWGPGPQPRHVP